MFDEVLKGLGCDSCCNNNKETKPKKQTTSCDVLWTIILVMIVLKGGCFGLDLCTLLILMIVFGKDILCKVRSHSCPCANN